MTYEDIKKVNESIDITKLKNAKTGQEVGDYVEVNQRIKAFRMLYPEGCIKTEMLSNVNGVCIFKASVYKCYELIPFSGEVKEIKRLLGTGTAYEKENSTFINRTSYIENCETSAVGRALAMLGIGIDTSVASKEEVENAVNNQELTEEDAMNITFGGSKHPGQTILEVYESGDEKFLNWYLNSEKTSEEVKKAIEMLTPLKRIQVPDDEEQEQRLYLLNKIMTTKDIDGIKKEHMVSDLTQLSTEEMEKIVNE